MYLLFSVLFGIPYGLVHAYRTAEVKDDPIKPWDAPFLALICALMWPVLMVYAFTRTDEVREEKHALKAKRNAHLLQVQMDNHAIAMKERKARHKREIAEFDAALRRA
jgi:hypothetical protein